MSRSRKRQKDRVSVCIDHEVRVAASGRGLNMSQELEDRLREKLKPGAADLAVQLRKLDEEIEADDRLEAEVHERNERRRAKRPVLVDAITVKQDKEAAWARAKEEIREHRDKLVHDLGMNAQATRGGHSIETMMVNWVDSHKARWEMADQDAKAILARAEEGAAHG